MPDPHSLDPITDKTHFFTIGHSTRTITEFVDLLRAAEVQLVVDVRSIRRSRTNPQYNEATVGDALAAYQVGYVPIPELGGRRKREKAIDQVLNAFWKHRSFHNYADYALTDGFKDGLEQLLEVGSSRRCAIMCSEAVWWRCHRRIIADYLLGRGEEVFHIMEGGKLVPATLTQGAMVQQDEAVIYPGSVDRRCC
ncbi:DUF488 domain-containing protein [Pseudorhizobium flavum]|uniref:DUF488 domain-containing protein n=1 Tax=Pseudorhizobium flavum TaxID=1335061 RepID=UPI003770263E